MAINIWDKLRSAFGGVIVDGTDVGVDATNFDGNLAPTDDTLQKVSQKLDDLTVAGMGGIEYTGSTPANNELLAGTGNNDEAKGSGITLTTGGKIAYDDIGEADISLSGSGGSITINSANIATYRDRTIYIDHTNTFTIQMDQISSFYSAGVTPFFLRFVNRGGSLVGLNATVGNTIGGRLTQTIPADEAITFRLPPSGTFDYPIISTGTPLNNFDILQVNTNQGYNTQSQLDMLCNRLIEASGNITLQFAPSDSDCAFYIHNQGVNTVTLSSLRGATFNGNSTYSLNPDDLIWMWNASSSSNYVVELINNAGDPVHNAFLDEVTQTGTRFDLSENVFVNEDNVTIDTNTATGVPVVSNLNLVPETTTQQTIDLGTLTGLQFSELVGGRLLLNITATPTSTGGFLPDFLTLALTFGSNTFTFPLTSLDSSGSTQIISIDIPNVDYSTSINVSPTASLVLNFSGYRYVGTLTINAMQNVLKGTLHDSIVTIAQIEAQNVQANLETEIDALRGEIGDEEASIEALLPRVSPYQDITVTTPDIYARFLDSTGSDSAPTDIANMNQVSADNPVYEGNNVALYVGVREPHNYILKNNTQSTSIALDNATPNVSLVESLSYEGFTYFVYQVTSLTSGDVYEVDEVRVIQRVEWAGRLNDIDAEIQRIDDVLDHAILNLPAKTVDWLENDIDITEQVTPTIEATDYNKSLGSGGTQKIYYEPNANTPSGGTLVSRPFSELSGSQVQRKLIYFNSGHTFSNADQLMAFDGVSTNTTLIQYLNGTFYGKKFIPASGGGSVTQKIYPAPQNRVSGEGIWQTLPTLTFVNGIPQPLNDELFFERNLPDIASTLNIQYRGHANGNIFGSGTTTLANVGGSSDVSITFTISDGSETATVQVLWRASQREIRVSVTERVSSGLATINDLQVILEFDQTRTIPPTPSSVRNIDIGNVAVDRAHVFAIKPSATNTVILVSDEIEFDTGYSYTTLFGATSAGTLTIATEDGIFLNYENVEIVNTVTTDLENHADLPQYGLFRTIYNHQDIANIDTQMTVRDDNDNEVNVGVELVLKSSGGKYFRLSVNEDGSLVTTEIV